VKDLLPLKKKNTSIQTGSRGEIKASLSIRNGSTKEALQGINSAPHVPFRGALSPGDG